MELYETARHDIKHDQPCSYLFEDSFCVYYLDHCGEIETCPYKRRKDEKDINREP